MQSAICLLLVVPMRKEPSHRSEMVSQILFGEYVTVREEKDDFVNVKCAYDGYEGWVQANQLTAVSDDQVLTTNEYIGIDQEEVLVNYRGRHLPFAFPIYYPEKTADHLLFGNEKVQYVIGQGAPWKVDERPFNKNNLDIIIDNFLETPYLWGGKSVYGIDCSGFVQQTFKLFSVPLLRDAYLQAEQGTSVSSLSEAKLGDLVFFQNEKGRVTHVGILLENGMIAHASGKVRIDPVDEKGIVNNETGKRTHQFHSIRRFF